MKHTLIGVDLAKEVIQVCRYSNKKIYSNQEMSHTDFRLWLFNIKPATIIFEVCSTSNYWKQTALKAGHRALLISAKLVAAVRQNQKTDKNDALAIVQAAQLPEIRFISGKTPRQQQLQSILRFRELAIKQKTALSNQLKSLLLELNIRSTSRAGGLSGCVNSALEDAENDLSDTFRSSLKISWETYKTILKSIESYEVKLAEAIEEFPDCKRLLKLEGIGIVNAINLYIVLGTSELGYFADGSEVAACIGLTPIQYSSGGKTQIGSIGRRVKNNALRSHLIIGALSTVSQVIKRAPKTQKEAWVHGLVERKGKKCAAVALANKTVRTAFAMLKNGTEYRAKLLAA